MHLVQYCNVGNIVGGTAACAWSICRALPECQHTIIFRSSLTSETLQAFSAWQTQMSRQLTSQQMEQLRPSLVILHNTSASVVSWKDQPPQLSCPVWQYAHSTGKHAAADRTFACSNFLRKKLQKPSMKTLLQGVPLPQGDASQRGSEGPLIVGRLCTPTARKWPASLIPWYSRLAKTFPLIRWEFVGCPASLQADLAAACQSRVRFYPAGWHARRHLWNWHVLLYHNPDLPETFGRTVAESMRAGCVPLVDDAGGFTEQISPDSGFLCREVADFESALQKMSNRDCWQQVSHQARRTSNARFSLKQLRNRLLNEMQK